MIIKGEKIGCSSDFWNNYKQDIKLAADLGEDPACCLLLCAGLMNFTRMASQWQMTWSSFSLWVFA